MHRGAYVRVPWNVLDLFVLVFDYVDLFYPVNVTQLRAVRALRPLRTIQRIAGLRRVVDSFVSSMPYIMDTLGLLALILFIFAILGLELFGGSLHMGCYVAGNLSAPALNDTAVCGARECAPPGVCTSNSKDLHGYFGFDDILDAVLLALKVASMDDWPSDVQRHQEAVGHSAWIFFVLIVILCTWSVLNLTLAIIAEKMQRVAEVELPPPPPQTGLRPGQLAGACLLQPLAVAMCLDGDRHAELADFFALLQEGARAQLKEQAERSAESEKTAAAAPEGNRPGQLQKRANVPYGLTVEIPASESTKATEREESSAAEAEEEGSEQEPQPQHSNAAQRWAFAAVHSRYFKWFFLGVTLINTLALAVDHYPSQELIEEIVDKTNFWCSVLFLVEFAVKLIGLGICGYFCDALNVLEFALCVFSLPDLIWSDSSAQGANSLRTFRILRIARTLRLASSGRMQILIRALFASIAECMWLTVIILMFLLVGAVLGTQFFPDELPSAGGNRMQFTNLWQALLTMFIFSLTGEGWGTLLRLANEQYSRWSSLFFVTCFLLGNCMLLNVFVAIITANIALDDPPPDAPEDEGSEDTERRRSTVPDLMSPRYSMTPRTRRVRAAAVETAKELKWVSAGSASRLTRIRQICRLFLLSSRQSTTLKGKALGLMEAAHPLRQRLAAVVRHRAFDVGVTMLIVASCVLIALETPQMQADHPQRSEDFRIVDVVFAVLFTMEVLVRILAFGFFCESDTAYLRAPPRPGAVAIEDESFWERLNGWNLADLAVAVIAVLSTFVPSLRSARSLRALRVVSRASGVRRFVDHTVSVLPSVIDTLFLLVAFCFIWAILGTQLLMGTYYRCTDPAVQQEASCQGTFNRSRPTATSYELYNSTRSWVALDYNFDNVLQAMAALFYLVAADSWAEVMWSGIDSGGVGQGPVLNNRPWFSLYFLAFMVLANFLLVNFFVGVVIDAIMEKKREHEATKMFDAMSTQGFRQSLRDSTDFRMKATRWLHAQHVLRESQPEAVAAVPSNALRRLCYRMATGDAGPVQVEIEAHLHDGTPVDGDVFVTTAPKRGGRVWTDSDSDTLGSLPGELAFGKLVCGPGWLPQGTRIALRFSRPCSVHVLCVSGDPEAPADAPRMFKHVRRASRATLLASMPAGDAESVPAWQRERRDGMWCAELPAAGWTEGPGLWTVNVVTSEVTPLRSFYTHVDSAVELPATQTLATAVAVIAVPDEVEVTYLDIYMACVIVPHVLVLLTQHWGEDSAWTDFREVAVRVFLSLYILEIVIKMLGITPAIYFKSGWNRFDFLVVALAIIGNLTMIPGGVGVLRSVRIFRLLRSSTNARGVYKMFMMFLQSLPNLGNVAVLLISILFVFGAIGVELFGKVPHDGVDFNEFRNFNNVYYAMAFLVQGATTGWRAMMDAAIHAGTGAFETRLYWFLFIGLTNMLILNLFVAVVVESFEANCGLENALAGFDGFEGLKRHWQSFDPDATGWAPAGQVLHVVLDAEQPIWGISVAELWACENRDRLPHQDQSQFELGQAVDVCSYGELNWRRGTVLEPGPTAGVCLAGWTTPFHFDRIRPAYSRPLGPLHNKLRHTTRSAAGGSTRFTQELRQLSAIAIPVSRTRMVNYGEFVASLSLRVVGLPHAAGVALTRMSGAPLRSGYWGLQHYYAVQRLARWNRRGRELARRPSPQVSCGELLRFRRTVELTLALSHPGGGPAAPREGGDPELPNGVGGADQSPSLELPLRGFPVDPWHAEVLAEEAAPAAGAAAAAARPPAAADGGGPPQHAGDMVLASGSASQGTEGDSEATQGSDDLTACTLPTDSLAATTADTVVSSDCAAAGAPPPAGQRSSCSSRESLTASAQPQQPAARRDSGTSLPPTVYTTDSLQTSPEELALHAPPPPPWAPLPGASAASAGAAAAPAAPDWAGSPSAAAAGGTAARYMLQSHRARSPSSPVPLVVSPPGASTLGAAERPQAGMLSDDTSRSSLSTSSGPESVHLRQPSSTSATPLRHPSVSPA
eukprot:TRINITY_DN17048_c0_g1_i1.p1 TRINITY_DN17048_c0_g1~~TRINITY_DN17048_c0_g1_i1.p1  ORF type:complete len:2253 (+),score=562.75 TRINITY_DN17048_c0_g1_i1:718-6759(+)